MCNLTIHILMPSASEYTCANSSFKGTLPPLLTVGKKEKKAHYLLPQFHIAQ